MDKETQIEKEEGKINKTSKSKKWSQYKQKEIWDHMQCNTWFFGQKRNESSNIVQAVKDRLENTFEGSIGWYVETVKLDLVAREIIERIPRTKPQLYRLIRKGEWVYPITCIESKRKYICLIFTEVTLNHIYSNSICK